MHGCNTQHYTYSIHNYNTLIRFLMAQEFTKAIHDNNARAHYSLFLALVGWFYAGEFAAHLCDFATPPLFHGAIPHYRPC